MLAQQNSLLDKLSTQERFASYYASFLATEKSLVRENILAAIPRGRVLNVGCAGNGVERTLFPISDYQIFGVDINQEDLQILHKKKLYNGLYQANIISLPFAHETFEIIYLRCVLHHLVYPENILVEGCKNVSDSSSEEAY